VVNDKSREDLIKTTFGDEPSMTKNAGTANALAFLEAKAWEENKNACQSTRTFMEKKSRKGPPFRYPGWRGV